MNAHTDMAQGEPVSELHAAALERVLKGERVIPIEPNGKQPLIKRWNESALSTPEEVNAFWSETPDANIAIIPEDLGLAVVEQDPGGSVESLNLPATYEVQSPRGGTHYYFVGSVPPSASKLAPHVDTRGRSSYVLVPPSVVNGKPYRIKADRDIAVLPFEIETALAQRADAGTATTDQLDLPGNVITARKRIADLMARGDVAIEGRGGDNRTYTLACELVKDLGLSVPKALEAMAPWNAKCLPPWPEAELQAKLEHAAEYGQNEAGTYATRPAAEVFELPPEAVAQETERKPASVTLRPIRFADLLGLPVKSVEEIIPGLIEKGIATMLSGPGGTHKSRVALQLGLSIQAGAKVFGKPTMPATFVYLDYENGENEVARRVQKMNWRLKLPALDQARYHDYKTAHVAGDGPVPPYESAPALATVSDDAVTLEPLYYALYDYLRSINGHKFVVLDSCYNVLRFTGQAKVNETAVKAALNLLDYVCSATNSTIVYLWHPSRAGMERGDASGWSVAWENTPRARLSLTKVENTKDAFDLKVEKRNNGVAGEVLTLHWMDGVLLPLSEADKGTQSELFFEACVRVAYEAAENNSPITRQKNLAQYQVVEIERAAGFKPSNREIKDQLEKAIGAKRLRYIPGRSHHQAGYYPVETDALLLRTTGVDTHAEQKERERAIKAKADGEAAAKDAATVPADYSEPEPASGGGGQK